MDIDDLLPRSHGAKFLDVPYEERWECLRPIIVQLYMGKYGPNGKSMTMGQVAVFMRDNYSFHAAETQYRHRFNKWGVRRRILVDEKKEITAALGRRTRPEMSTSHVTLDPDKAVDKKRMKRYLNGQIRDHKAEPMSPGALGKKSGQPSPFGGTGATPSYLNIESPEAATPGREAAGPSPTMQLVRQKVALDRSSLFLQGRHLELLASCGKEDRITLTNYLHDFYIHSFVVAKYWGRGPQMGQWTACLDGFDIQDPHSWTEWPLHEKEHSMSFAESMGRSITNSTFSLTAPNDLPISTESLSQSVQQNPELLRVDAWKVAIMAEGPPDGIDEIYPFHLAAAFLDGGNTCCNMISALSSQFGADYLFFHDRDDLGHTVLDNFMITILRSHTSLGPEHVSARFNPPHRFPGEEKDICGRWDADSPVVRALFRHGYARVPTKWKHAFCHTAAQAICHSVIAIWGSPASPPIDALSGLFLKLGPLHTLVVVAFHLAHRGMPGETMFGALAILVCLLSLGAHASLRTVMSVEDILGRAEPGRCCHKLLDAYDLMRAVPHDLVAHWSTDCQTGWICILQVLLLVRHDGDSDSQQDADSGHGPDGDEFEGDSNADSEEDSHGAPQIHDCGLGTESFSAYTEWLELPCGNPKLGLLWATIQVELLTYCRIDTADSWLSSRFSMGALKTWLEGGMMRYHSPCGWFDCDDFVCPVAEEVCKEHFMNMDVYDRATFLERPELIAQWLEVVPPNKV
ncbi:hypothetical protein C8A01DRAFT_47468 [Parachaetomium inaequale]|uniref:Clr5 domain-containing protein n=1 Tax=Parachaetomium inaequale TaxID=2588326 RepID=A0AAN6PDR2_9PEZI|nr:hypothetical protein C8A01DRAFT_47468 [Parachaetomium inaequale]